MRKQLKGDKAIFKIEIIEDESKVGLERKVNEFIKNKIVISISYAVAPCGYAYIRECCILYEE